jgi:hypothetical protein
LVRKKKHATAGVAGIIAHANRSNLLEGQLVENPANFFIPPRTAYTPQIPQLFSYSLQENLLLGLERSEIEIAEALQLSVFERDVAAMSEGLETVVGPKGVRLSWGQLQRAAAARMSVRHPSLLVFDDLSSALDIKTEQKLWSRLCAPEVPIGNRKRLQLFWCFLIAPGFCAALKKLLCLKMAVSKHEVSLKNYAPSLPRVSDRFSFLPSPETISCVRICA